MQTEQRTMEHIAQPDYPQNTLAQLISINENQSQIITRKTRISNKFFSACKNLD